MLCGFFSLLLIPKKQILLSLWTLIIKTLMDKIKSESSADVHLFPPRGIYFLLGIPSSNKINRVNMELFLSNSFEQIDIIFSLHFKL